MEAYVFAGVAGIYRVKKGKVPIYAYAAVNTLSTTTMGRNYTILKAILLIFRLKRHMAASLVHGLLIMAIY
jgi:hypothetical protein